MNGKFITFEGIDKVGKTTQAKRLAKWLRDERQIEVVETREPGGTALGEKLRDIFLQEESLDAITEMLLAFTSRYENWRHNIAPALQSGKWVICDRFVDSTTAYQGGGRGAPAAVIAALSNCLLGGITPDITFYMRSHPIHTATTATDVFEREDAAFYQRVCTAYDDIAKKDKQRVVVIDVFDEDRRVSKHMIELAICKNINKKFFNRRIRKG